MEFHWARGRQMKIGGKGCGRPVDEPVRAKAGQRRGHYDHTGQLFLGVFR